MPAVILLVQHELGLHARPAAEFVKHAVAFPCAIKVKKLGTVGDYANAKSILSLMTLSVSQGDSIEVVAEGEQADGALDDLRRLVEGDFREP